MVTKNQFALSTTSFVSRLSLNAHGFASWILQLSMCCILFSCGSYDQKTVDTTEEIQAGGNLSGKQLSQQYCQSCHLYPEPSLLDKHTWERSVLPLMGRLFGIYEDNVPRSKILNEAIDRNLVINQNIFPEHQLMDDETWQKISDYYISSAPESLPSKPANIVFAPLDRFEVIIPSYSTMTPVTTMLKIDAKTSNIYVGGSSGNKGSLTILNKEFKIIDAINLPSPPVDLTIHGDALDLTLVGPLILGLKDNPPGQLLRIFRSPGSKKYSSYLPFLADLRRPLQTVFQDMNADGNDDILIADFGYYTGSLNFHEYIEGSKGSYKRATIKNVPGAIRVYVRDMNSDGNKDIVALFAQGDEGISVFINKGNGKFSEERILTFSPAYGSVYFELADMNNDGHPDILYCNGDNGDYPPILKEYHGIRIFENDGNNNFRQVYFYPMHGAYKSSVADFDLDGDLDIVGISNFPDFKARPRHDFVYLENLGDYSFSPEILQKEIPARWLTFDIGDLDGNGYQDILLGSTGTYKDTTGSDQQIWRKGPSLLLLKNVGKQKNISPID